MGQLTVKLIARAVFVQLTFSLYCAYANDIICDGTIRCSLLDSTASTNFQPHPTDCSKSFKCKNGKPVIYTCPDGQFFSFDDQQCLDASKVICNKRCIEPPASSTTPPGEDSCSFPTSTTTTVCESASCPEIPGNHPFFYPQPNDCGGYCICDWSGTAHDMFCPTGLHFNPDLNICDWPGNSGSTAIGC